MTALSQPLRDSVLAAMRADDIGAVDKIQRLWSGYGEILRLNLTGGEVSSVILKYISYPASVTHPRGWASDLSHQRKIKSYQVEMHWYQHWARQCSQGCRVPVCYASEAIGDDHLVILEDLDAAGFAVRRESLDRQGVSTCLHWLANFHARFMGGVPTGLWPKGTYWHLDTRPDELAAMPASRLKQAAAAIDARLHDCHYKTLVHGDAKVANFCFSADLKHVAAVDFQYVGGGCGMKDVAYFLGSCLSEAQCQQWQGDLLDEYFNYLQQALVRQDHDIDFIELQDEWSALYPYAWTDYYRFLAGWMPTHKKINKYTQYLADGVLAQIS